MGIDGRAQSSAAKQTHAALRAVEGPLVGGREPAVSADEAAPTGRRDWPLDRRQSERVLVRQDVREDPAEDLRGNPVRIAANALAAPADDGPDDHVARRLVPVG